MAQTLKTRILRYWIPVAIWVALIFQFSSEVFHRDPGSGRAHALEGETAQSRRAYESFFSLWKEADPDIPILQEAKAEYVKLQ